MLLCLKIHVGLPPQVRGALPAQGRDRTQVRLTPAGAGSTPWWWAALILMWAYPRRCGEHGSERNRISEKSGLPPQVRGAPQPCRALIGELGLTPAGAGSTDVDAAESARWGAYPRRCGEHGDDEDRSVMRAGLPPQVRGARCRSGLWRRVGGLTPAGAGSTGSNTRRARLPKGLPPQVRGAPDARPGVDPLGGLTPAGAGSTFWERVDALIRDGLPPQVRGAQRRTAVTRDAGRLTPAGAGSTQGSALTAWMVLAYPRRCGEHPRCPRTVEQVGGLPPQVRGAPDPTGPVRHHRGLTPAGAGSTNTRTFRANRGQAYPRRCGEHTFQGRDGASIDGLPPQVRGAPHLNAAHPAEPRLTPAGAGSTRCSWLRSL